MSGWTGVDFSKFDPDQVVEHVESEAGRTALENITRADPDRRWTVREVAEHVSIGGIGPIVVGSPITVADQLEGWIDDTDIDGFNLAFVVRPETFVDVVDMLVPELAAPQSIQDSLQERRPAGEAFRQSASGRQASRGEPSMVVIDQRIFRRRLAKRGVCFRGGGLRPWRVSSEQGICGAPRERSSGN